MKTLIKNAQIVNEGKIFKADVLIENDLIAIHQINEPYRKNAKCSSRN